MGKISRYRNFMSNALRYLTDEHGKKTAVVLPISDYEKLMEDLEDLAVVAERRNEPTIPHKQFIRELPSARRISRSGGGHLLF